MCETTLTKYNKRLVFFAQKAIWCRSCNHWKNSWIKNNFIKQRILKNTKNENNKLEGLKENKKYNNAGLKKLLNQLSMK